MKQSCQTTLSKAQSWWGVIFRGTRVDLPGVKVPVAACLWKMQLTVEWVRATRPAIALCRMPSWAIASTSCLILIGVGWGIMSTINENWGNRYATVDSYLPQCKGKFGEMTTKAAVLDFDYPTWDWSKCPAKVRSDFVGEGSQVHFVLISAH